MCASSRDVHRPDKDSWALECLGQRGPDPRILQLAAPDLTLDVGGGSRDGNEHAVVICSPVPWWSRHDGHTSSEGPAQEDDEETQTCEGHERTYGIGKRRTHDPMVLQGG